MNADALAPDLLPPLRDVERTCSCAATPTDWCGHCRPDLWDDERPDLDVPEAA